ncbi:hypothetical protein HOE04_05520 [archaeon]|jgi:hypothetical protein|nr:hypothetical protein [archaeon]
MVKDLKIESEYRERIMKAYEGSPNKLNLSAEDFMGNLEWRIYTEFCLDNPQGNHRDYVGSQGFEKYILDEIHYEHERKGFEGYEIEIRDKTLRAFTERGISFLKFCKDYRWPMEGDDGNLRVSLEKWMPVHSEELI